MNYYEFKPACDTKETGSQYPQVQRMTPGYNKDSNVSLYAMARNIDEFPDFMPDFDSFVLHNQAKRTDLLSTFGPGWGFLISPRLKAIFEQYKMVSHRYYPAKVFHKQVYYDYYFIHIIGNVRDCVNCPLSTFFIYKSYATNERYIAIDSFDDLLMKEKKLIADNPGEVLSIWAEKIVLNNSFDKDLALFEIGNFDASNYINEELKSELVLNSITGCDILPTKKLAFLD